MHPAVIPAIEAAGSIATNAVSGLFGSNQAAKNRSFQERMYYQQLADNRENWEIMNRYNLPSAELARMRQAGLNPLLMYEGGMSSMAASPSQSASAPHGSQGQANFNNPFANFSVNMKQMQLLDAELEQKYADIDKTKSETDWQELENKFQKENYDVRLAIQRGDLEYLNRKVEDVCSQIYYRGVLSTEQALTLSQARLYEIKRFNLDEHQITESLKQRWQDIATNKIAANAQLKNACANMLNAVTNQKESSWRIGAMAQDIYYKAQYQPYMLKNMSLQNELNKFDVGIKAQDILLKDKQLYMYNNTGSTDMPMWAVPFFLYSEMKYGGSGSTITNKR